MLIQGPDVYTDRETRKSYVRVSTVLRVLDPEAFSDVDPDVLAAAQARGTTLHMYFALMLLAIEGLATWPARPDGVLGDYFDSLAAFVETHKPRPLRIEEPAINAKMGYAGQPDTECLLDEVDSIIDLKTGGPRPVHAVQLQAYKRLEGYGTAKRLYSLYATQQGPAQLVEHTTDHVDWSGFHAALAVLNWRRLRG